MDGYTHSTLTDGGSKIYSPVRTRENCAAIEVSEEEIVKAEREWELVKALHSAEHETLSFLMQELRKVV